MARWPAHTAAAHASEQKAVFRQLAHTSGVDAPHTAQAERGEADELMAMMKDGLAAWRLRAALRVCTLRRLSVGVDLAMKFL